MPVAPKFTVNTTGLFRDLNEFQKTSRRDFAENLQLAMRGVVRHVVAITPPNHVNKSGGGDGELVGGIDARKYGEAAIMADLYRIFFPATRGFMAKFFHTDEDGRRLAERKVGFRYKPGGNSTTGEVLVRKLTLDQMRAFHKSRKGSKGRVRGGGAGGQLNFKHAQQLKTGLNKAQIAGLEFAIVSPKDFNKYAKMIKERVGWLGHGWGSAASRLKVPMPTYMARHESSHGHIEMKLGPDKFVIRAANTVGYASDVKGYKRRLQDAVNRQAEAFRKRTQHFLEKRAARLAARTPSAGAQ